MKLLGSLVIAVLVVLAAAAALKLGGRYVEERHGKRLWDPEILALVNGRPVKASSLDRLLKLGFYPPISLPEDPAGGVDPRRLLDALIEEELVLQAAEREGIEPGEKEIEEYLADLLPGRRCAGREGDCPAPQGEDLEYFRRAARTRLILNETARRTALRLGRRAGSEWTAFQREWTRRHAGPRVYEARALLAEKSPRVKDILEKNLSSKGGLAHLEAKLRENGVPFVVSDAVFLDPSQPSAAKLFPGINLAEALREAASAPGGLSRVLPLEESWGVLEVARPVPKPAPEEMIRAARRGYESMVSDRAFREYMDELKREAAIEINPSFPYPPGG
ncbi:MAG: SurA N-terminal domain-containing protein [Deltaproteobacteria bacterium]|jgi:hypothetical protein|nr:SurA N-terminal domain-containing protein [Deltaproteobacteria bacterium]